VRRQVILLVTGPERCIDIDPLRIFHLRQRSVDELHQFLVGTYARQVGYVVFKVEIQDIPWALESLQVIRQQISFLKAAISLSGEIERRVARELLEEEPDGLIDADAMTVYERIAQQDHIGVGDGLEIPKTEPVCLMSPGVAGIVHVFGSKVWYHEPHPQPRIGVVDEVHDTK